MNPLDCAESDQISASIVIHSPPYGADDPKDALDLAMVLATFDYKVNLIFCDQGILGLIKQQAPNARNVKRYTDAYKSLAFYDIEHIYILKPDMEKIGIKSDQLICESSPLTVEQLKQMLNQSHQVWNF